MAEKRKAIPDRIPQELAVIFTTALGWMGVVWRRETEVTAITFGHRSPVAAKTALAQNAPDHPKCHTLNLSLPRPAYVTVARWELVQRLSAYAEGHPDSFLDVALDLSHLTEFQAEVVNICRHIGYGKTLSYAELAARAGSPRAARAVGNVMRTNRFPLVIPCHRVVGSAGSLGGYSAPDGLQMKQRLLRMEADGVGVV